MVNDVAIARMQVLEMAERRQITVDEVPGFTGLRSTSWVT